MPGIAVSNLVRLPVITMLVPLCLNLSAPEASGAHASALWSSTPDPHADTAFSGEPAAFSYQQGRGQILSSAEAAGLSAGSVLRTPSLGDPALQMIAGPLEVVVAPFAALYSAAKAKHDRVPSEKMRQAESDLTAALSNMARQEHFAKAFQAAVKTAPVVAPGQHPGAELGGATAAIVLAPHLGELRLERVGKGDEFRLNVRAAARILRRSDGSVVAEREATYQSGKDLFIEWTGKGAIEGVARTAYDRLAQRLAEELLGDLQPGALKLGAGHRKANRPPAPTTVAIANSAATDASDYRLLPVLAADTIDLYSDATLVHPTVPRPIVRDEAASAAVEATSWALDGMGDHPNSIVQLTACAVAIPIGLWNQAAAVFAPGADRVDRAEAALRAAARESRPHDKVATQLAACLAPRTYQGLYVVNGIRPLQERKDSMSSAATGAVPVAYNPGPPPAAGGSRVAFQVHLSRTALVMGEGTNPKLTLELEGEMRITTAADETPVACFPFNYRSEARKYKDWAAHDAKLFRDSLETAYNEIALAAADQLVMSRIVAPKRAKAPLLAQNVQILQRKGVSE